MELIDKIKEKFQVWFLIQRDKYLRNQLAQIPSDNPDDYYFDNLTNSFIYKDASLNIQIGWKNTLNVLKTQIESVNIHTENLEAIIDDIAQVNIDTTALTAIISNIAYMNVNVNNLQAVIANIASIDVDTGNLQAIISNIASMTVNVNNLQAVIANVASMDVNVNNLQAIITDIANIETLNTTISGNITSLTAIIANIGTMNTNIDNLQAIITDIANIETLNTTISGNIATVNTNINNLQAIIANIANINTLTTTISGNITSLTAIIANINTMNTNITNLQAIITDIANIETLNTTISGNITSLTAIIANIGTMNTNIGNLQAIITDIANIETQNIAMNIALATINTNIGTINTAITNIEAHEADIDINIQAVKDLDIIVSNQTNKGIIRSGSIGIGTSDEQEIDYEALLFNRIVVLLHAEYLYYADAEVELYKRNADDSDWVLLQDWEFPTHVGQDWELMFTFDASEHFKVLINNLSERPLDYKIVVFFSKNVKPELDEHIDTSNIHFLEDSINLANINEKLHASLAEVSESQHHVKTVSSDISLANLNEKSYNSLTDKPANVSQADYEADQAFGIENKKWITCTYGGGQNVQVVSYYRNLNANNMYLVFEFPKSLIINGKDLWITNTRIGIKDSDSNNYVDRFRLMVATNYLTEATMVDIDHDAVHGKGIGLITYGHGQTRVGTTRQRVTATFNCVNATPANLDIMYVQMEYYYAE